MEPPKSIGESVGEREKKKKKKKKWEKTSRKGSEGKASLTKVANKGEEDGKAHCVPAPPKMEVCSLRRFSLSSSPSLSLLALPTP